MMAFVIRVTTLITFIVNHAMKAFTMIHMVGMAFVNRAMIGASRKARNVTIAKTIGNTNHPAPALAIAQSKPQSHRLNTGSSWRQSVVDIPIGFSRNSLAGEARTMAVWEKPELNLSPRACLARPD